MTTTQSIFTKLVGINFTDTSIPVITRDPVLNNGSLMLFDFADTYCWPKQTAPANGDVVYNLVDGAPIGNINSAAMGFSGGGMTFSGVSGDNIDLGTSYDLSAAHPDFVMIAWIKQAATGLQNAGVIADGTNTSTIQKGLLAANTTYNSYFPTGIVGATTTNASVPTANIAASAITGNPVQLAVSWVGGVAQAYLNGNTYGNPASTVGSLRAAGTHLFLGKYANSFTGTIYRAYLESLTASGAAALSRVQADYTANLGRFS